MKIHRTWPALVAPLAGVFAPAQAQPSDNESPAGNLESIVVIGTRPSEAGRRLAGSLDVIGRDELEYEHVDDTMELLTKAPGTYLSRFNQGIINSDVSIRGFAGDGSTPHVKLLIDGIPSNLHAGYSEMDQLFPLGLGSVDVFKGTSDAHYGLYNIAGNYVLASRRDVGVTEVEVTAGSHETRELQAYSGLGGETLDQNYFIGYRQGEGYRDHTNLTKYVASGRWAVRAGDDSSLVLMARAAGYEGDAPGYLSREVARRSPRSSADYASQDGGEKDTLHASLHLDTALGDDLDLSVKTYWQSFERERWVRFSAAGAVQNRYDDERQAGLRASLGWDMSARWRMSAGLDAEQQDILEQRFGTVDNTRRRDVANALRNHHYDFDSLGGYIQVDHHPSDVLSWNFAVRVDRLDGDFTQIAAGAADDHRRMFEFGTIVQPKLNVLLAAGESVTLFANFGRSFQHPFGAGAYTSGPTDARDVSLNDGFEAGFSWRPARDADVRVSYWQQRASEEFISVDGTPRNVGETDRSGFDVAATWQVLERLGLWANYTRIESKIVTADDSIAAFAGNELRSIPGYTASAGLRFAPTPRLELRVHVDSQGDYFVNEANLGGRYGGYTLVGSAVSYRWNRWDLSLQLNNIFNEYHEYVFDFSEDGSDTIHSPGDGRSIGLTAGMRF